MEKWRHWGWHVPSPAGGSHSSGTALLTAHHRQCLASKQASREALHHQARVTSSTQQHTVCRAHWSPADPGGGARVHPQPAESPRPILQNKDDRDFSKYVHVPKALTQSERVVDALASLTKYPQDTSVSFVRQNQTKKTLISRYSKETFRYWEQAAASS